MRIDDLDTPRNRPGAEAQAIADLQWLGLRWDGPVLRQSERRGLYHSLLSALRSQGCLYPCHCSRRMLADVSAPTALGRSIQEPALAWLRIGAPATGVCPAGGCGSQPGRWIGLNKAR